MKYIFTIVFCMFLTVNASAYSDAHTENFNGVDIRFSPPNMAEQQSFQLRGVINKRETEILAEALPIIAKFLNHVRLKNSITYKDGLREPRKPYDYIKDAVSLVPYTTHGWVVTSDTIQFQTDFLVNFPESSKPHRSWFFKDDGGFHTRIGDYLFRDAYIFKKINGTWTYYDNFGEKPYGFLKCKLTQDKCTLDQPL